MGIPLTVVVNVGLVFTPKRSGIILISKYYIRIRRSTGIVSERPYYFFLYKIELNGKSLEMYKRQWITRIGPVCLWQIKFVDSNQYVNLNLNHNLNHLYGVFWKQWILDHRF
jgi:hypothetical protein